MSIRSLVGQGSTCWFTLLDEIEVELKFVSRKNVIDMRSKCTMDVRDKASGEMIEKVDVKKFDRMLVAATVVNWKGLKRKHLVDLNIAYDIKDEADGEIELPYDLDDAVDLMIDSQVFADFVNTNTKEYQRFAEAKKEAAAKKSSNSQKKD